MASLSPGAAHQYDVSDTSAALVILRRKTVQAWIEVEGDGQQWRLGSFLGREGEIAVPISPPVSIIVKPVEVNFQAGDYEIELRAADEISKLEREAYLAFALGSDRHFRTYLGDGSFRTNARKHFQVALQKFSGTNDFHMIALSRYELGIVEWYLGNLVGARKEMNLAADIWSKLNDPRSFAAENILGHLARQSGDINAAMHHYQVVLEGRLASKDSLHAAHAANNIGLIEFTKGNYEEAKERFAKAYVQYHLPILHLDRNLKSITEQPAETVLEVSLPALNNLALALDRLGDPSTANSLWGKYLESSQFASDMQTAISALNNYASNLLELGEFDEAYEYLTDALKRLEATPNDTWSGFVHQNLGNLFFDLRQLDRSSMHFARALEYRAAEGNPLNRAYTTLSLAKIALERGDWRSSLGSARGALEILGQSPADVVNLQIQLIVAKSLIGLGQLDQVQSVLTFANSLAVETGGARAKGETLFVEAMFLKHQGQPEAALEVATEASRVLQNAWAIELELESILLEAELLYLLGRFEDVQQKVRHGLDKLELARMNVGSPRGRASFFASMRELFLVASASLIATGNEVRAWQMIQSTKGRVSAESAANISFHSDVPTSRIVNLISAKVDELNRGTATGAEEERLREELRQLIWEWEESRSITPLAIPHFDPAWWISQLDVSDAILDFLVGEQFGIGLLITSQGVTSWTLPSGKELERWIAVVTSKNSDAESLSRASNKLAENLLTKLSDEHSRILIMPDGPLHRLSFAMLPDPRQAGSAPLVATSEVSYGISMATLSQWNHKRPASISIAAVPMSFETTASNDGPAYRSGVTLSPLPFAGVEARNLASLFPSENVNLKIGESATKGAVVKPDFLDADVLHFATHGLTDRDLPELSGLILSGVGHGLETLHLVEISSLKIGADLVVLSACGTAVGETVPGEGATSVAQAFFSGGAKGVVSSLWAIEDEVSMALMQSFYRSITQAKQHPAAALRDAQLELLGSATMRSIHQWAPFVYYGNPFTDR